jgi:hypothetical protein
VVVVIEAVKGTATRIGWRLGRGGDDLIGAVVASKMA